VEDIATGLGCPFITYYKYFWGNIPAHVTMVLQIAMQIKPILNCHHLGLVIRTQEKRGQATLLCSVSSKLL
jgi:hypothetical protein